MLICGQYNFTLSAITASERIQILASERRFQIFVSSTYRDLKIERDKLLRTLAEFNYIPAGMEFFPAIDEEQFKFIKRIIDESDYYVVVVGGHYGSIAPRRPELHRERV